MWLIRLPCSKADADALDVRADDFLDLTETLTLTAVLMEIPKPERWYVEAFSALEPDDALLARIQNLGSSKGKLTIEKLPDQDWVTMSQAGMEPIHAGRFYIHSDYYAGTAPVGSYALQIEAAQAFGTGTHATTSGCLHLLDQLTRRARFHNILDLGTGTGILAFAAARHWRRARITASDIDPVAIEVAKGFARTNHLGGAVELITATGLHHRRIASRAPYDLLIANILAGPLVQMAPDISAAVARSGFLMLAGLLDTQENQVQAAYLARGFKRAARLQQGDWPALLLRKR